MNNNIELELERLTIISEPYLKQYKNQKYNTVLCRCVCGNEKEIILTHLKNKHVTSCGCYKDNYLGNLSFKHGLSRYPLNNVWNGMLHRCYDEKHNRYHRYGGRGITVCEEWKNDFIAFYNWAIDKWKPRLVFDRIDFDKNYYPENCRFITYKESGNNTSTNKYLTIFNETKTMKQWSEDSRCIVHYNIFRQRIMKYKWAPEKALITP